MHLFPSAGGGGTGNLLPNKTWIGVVGDIVYQKADLGMICGLTASRAKVVSFSFPVGSDRLLFMGHEPSVYFTWKAVYRPLTYLSWLFIIFSSAITLIIYIGLLKISKESILYSQMTYYIFTTFVEQSRDTNFSTRGSVRYLAGFWLFFVLLVTTAYRSKLISFLMFPETSTFPTNMAQLSESEMHIGLHHLQGIAFEILKSSENSAYKKVYDKMKLITSDFECVEKALVNDKFVCIIWNTILNFRLQRNLSDTFGRAPVIKSASHITFVYHSFVTEIHCVFQKELAELANWSFDSGLVPKWWDNDRAFILNERKEWLTSENKSWPSYEDKSNDRLTTAHVSGPFFILCLGLGVSSLVFLGEKMVYWFSMNKRKLGHENK